MNKSEFIRAYADNLGVTIKEAEENFNAFIETLTQCLSRGEYVHVSGFARFGLKEKKERVGVNPQTLASGESVEKVVIKACKAPFAKFSKAYKERFN